MALKRTELKQRRRKPKPRLREETALLVFARQAGGCGCGHDCRLPISPGAIGYHHVFPKSKYPRLVDEADNVLGVNELCHAEHEGRKRKITRAAVARAERLATTGPMESYLDRTYPGDPDA